MAAEASSPGVPAAGAAGSTGGRRDGLWLLIIWIVLSVIACLLVALVWGPHMPPGRQSSSAASQQFDITVLGVIATPVIIGVLLYFGWALAFWRQKPGDETDAAPIHGNTRIQATWITVTSAIVLSLAVFGTYELIAPAGAGAGEGPQPIWKPAGTVAQASFDCGSATAAPTWKPGTSNILQVQVIGQQWAWTYRYPQFGCFETTHLELPVGEPVQFNVTSLDVIHSFWAYQLGVKADANPGVNNVAYTTPQHTGQFVVRCDELCGIWHGAMYDYGKVVSDSAFMSWAQSTQVSLASLTKLLPPYALTYDPTVLSSLGKVAQQLRSPSNIVIGGAAGCFPVLVGWAAVKGTVVIPAIVLFAVIFLWTPPHFWALAMKFRKDYAAANVPMLPVVAPPAEVTRKIVWYSYAMVAATLALAPYAGWIYCMAALGLGGWFLVEAHRLHDRVRAGVAPAGGRRAHPRPAPMRLFHLSIAYLTLLFVAVAVTALLPWGRW